MQVKKKHYVLSRALFSLPLSLSLRGWEEKAFVFSPPMTWDAESCDLSWGVESLLRERERDPLFTDRENHCRKAQGRQLEHSGLMGSPGQEHASIRKKKPYTLSLSKVFSIF